mmetsp:Transcript_18734/g.34798  ORF Transcript_18734/g.34798 Transcript_18734/m.34798 type:complete len:297 (-) Transcript_18734:142-1032(-)
MPSNNLPDISSLKLSELKRELTLYGIDSSNFFEKSEFTSALKNARDTLPRPSTTYREVGPSEEELRAAEKAKQQQQQQQQHKSSSRSSKRPSTSSSSHNRHHHHTSSSSTPPPPAPAPNPTTTTTTQSNNNKSDLMNKKRLLASRSPVTALQQIREHPSGKLLGERNNSFLPGAPFSFALMGSLQENDAAILRIPDGVCLKINAASVDRKSMENFLLQKGSIGVSLKVSSEENPALLPIWTFDKEKSKSYTVSDLGVEVCGPRTVRLLAFMEMGFRSGASVDLFVFGSVGLDRNKF